MLDHLSNRKRAGHRNLVHATVVAVCVLGLVASITLHFQPGAIVHRASLDAAVSDNLRAGELAPAPTQFLRTPAGDPSVPESSSVFTGSTPVTDEIPIAQF
jgi:hypothetical protein